MLDGTVLIANGPFDIFLIQRFWNKKRVTYHVIGVQ